MFMDMDRGAFVLSCSLILLQSMEISLQAEPCRHDQVSVQLVNGTSERNGRVELCWNHQWKAVCDSGWDQAEARTVCKELGYLNTNGHAIAVSGSYFGYAQDIYQLKQWNCGPTDTTLAYCSKSGTRQPCSSSETAGVHCLGGSNCRDWEIRLVHRQTESKGPAMVEICFSGVWGTICDDGWDDNDARVTCRQLGYFQATVSTGNTMETKQHLGHTSCMGQELRLMDCSHESIGVDTCGLNSNKNAAVVCLAPATQAIGNKSKVNTSDIAQSEQNNNSSSDIRLTRNPSTIIAGCTSGGIALLTVIALVLMIVVFIRKRRQHQCLILRFSKPSIHEDKPIHTYDEITTFAARMTRDTSNTTSTTGKIVQGVKYEISATDISTSSNQAYGYLQREKP